MNDPTSIPSLVDTFIKFEFEENLLNKKIKDIEFWQFIRFGLFYELIYQKGLINKRPESHIGHKNIINTVISSLKYSFVNNLIHGLSSKDVLILNHPRRVFYKEFYHEIYTDPILENLDYSYYVFETPDKNVHYSPVKTKNLKYLDFFLNYKHIKKRLCKRVLSSEDIETIMDISNNINRKFEIDIFEYLSNKAIDLIIFIELFDPYFHRIMKKTNPRIILEIVHYSFFNMIFNYLIRKHNYNISIVELQHGTMGRYHWGYNYYKKITLDIFPDYIFLWGNFWKKNTRFPVDDHQLIITGFPYFEERINQLDKQKMNGDKKVILFISQWTIGDKLSKLASNLSDKIDKKKYRIIYKLHPNEYKIWKEQYPWLEKKGLEVIDNNNRDIYYYFNLADIQIGVNSTAIIEGLGFNLITFIYKEFGHEYMEELYNQKYVTLIESVEELFTHLKSMELKKDEHIGLSFWEKDSLNKIKNSIQLIY